MKIFWLCKKFVFPNHELLITNHEHMHHVAIMNKTWKLIPKILSGEKVIESRWYQTRRVPWNRIEKGDVVFFKNAGEQIIVKADVDKVLQFEMKGLNEVKEIVGKYGEQIALVNKDPASWGKLSKYCILFF